MSKGGKFLKKQSEWQMAKARNISIETFNGGQFSLSTQWVKSNYFKIKTAFIIQGWIQHIS